MTKMPRICRDLPRVPTLNPCKYSVFNKKCVNGYEPDKSRAWGWRVGYDGDSKPLGNCIGWVDGEDLYLEPKATYAAAKQMATASGGNLVVSENTLRKRLKGRNLLRSTDKRTPHCARDARGSATQRSTPAPRCPGTVRDTVGGTKMRGLGAKDRQHKLL